MRLAPVDDPQVFFSISGSEAVEIALKTAVAATGRPGIVAFEPSYHGLTMGSLAVTSRPGFREPFAAHLHGHVRRFPYGSRVKLENVAAVLVEPIVGGRGLLPPPGWLAELARLCRGRRSPDRRRDFTGFGDRQDVAVEHEGSALTSSAAARRWEGDAHRRRVGGRSFSAAGRRRGRPATPPPSSPTRSPAPPPWPRST